MANIIILYGSASIPIDEQPIIDGTVNPIFEARLEYIEPFAFNVSIVDDEVQITYSGIEVVQIKHGGDYLDVIPPTPTPTPSPTPVTPTPTPTPTPPSGNIEGSYSEIISDREAANLIVGNTYTITDFATRHFLVDADSGQDISVTFTGTTEPLVLTAISPSEFAIEAYSPLYPNDIIHYDWNAENWKWDMGYGDLTTDDSNPTIISGWKGIIYFRHDTLNNNSKGSDFRNVKFRRYKQGCPEWDSVTVYAKGDFVKSDGFIWKSLVDSNEDNSISDPLFWLQLINLSTTEYINVKKGSDKGIPSIDADFQDFLTFVPASGSTYDESFKNNILKPFRDDYITYWNWATSLDNTIFFNKSTDNESKSYFNHNTFLGQVDGIIFLEFYNRNTVGAGFSYNTVGANFSYNTVGANCYYNTVGANFSYSTVGANYYNNTVGAGFSYNTVGAGFTMNEIADNSCNSIDFTGATHVHNDYNCQIFKNSAGITKLSYYDASNVLQIVDLTD